MPLYLCSILWSRAILENAIGWRGDRIEVQMKIPLEESVMLIGSSGKAPGMEFRPFGSGGMHPDLKAKMC